MATSGVSANSLAEQLLAAMKKQEKHAGQAGGPAGDFAAIVSGGVSAAQSASTAPKSEATVASVAEKSPAQEFLDYMKKTPEERMQEAWLRAHGIDPEDFEAMPPEKKQALMDEMKEDIEAKLKEAAEKGKENGQPNMLIGFGLG
jgi:predicted flavoprotein YhiN